MKTVNAQAFNHLVKQIIDQHTEDLDHAGVLENKKPYEYDYSLYERCFITRNENNYAMLNLNKVSSFAKASALAVAEDPYYVLRICALNTIQATEDAEAEDREHIRSVLEVAFYKFVDCPCSFEAANEIIGLYYSANNIFMDILKDIEEGYGENLISPFFENY